VGIGYPLSKSIYTWRRGPDLTPPTPDGKYEYPPDRQGNPRRDLKFGEADKFLRFIEHDVISYVEGTVFQHVDLAKGRRALFGHSYGGIFALNALYTSTALFDAYIAASPSIFWSDYALVKHQEADFLKRASAQPPVSRPPSVVVTWGTCAQELERQPGEAEENFEKRKAIAESNELKPSALALIGRLGKCPGVGRIQSHELPGEDHGSAAVVGLQKGIMDILYIE
jgi:pimeloyl-ACP methyl ester carboxylesterase